MSLCFVVQQKHTATIRTRIRQCADACPGHRIDEVMMSREQAAGRPERAGPAARGRLRIYLTLWWPTQ
jgi:hypothetical protein